MPRKRTLTGRKERELHRHLARIAKERQKRYQNTEAICLPENDDFLENAEYAIDLETAQKKLELKHCTLCLRRWFVFHIEADGLCTLCHMKISVVPENNLHYN